MEAQQLRRLLTTPSKPSKNSVARSATTWLFWTGSWGVSIVISLASLVKLGLFASLFLSEVLGIYRPKDQDMQTILWSMILH